MGELRTWSIINGLDRVCVPTFMINGQADITQDFVVEPLFRGICQVKWVTMEKSSHTPCGRSGKGIWIWLMVSCMCDLHVYWLSFYAEPQKWLLPSDTDIDVEVWFCKVHEYDVMFWQAGNKLSTCGSWVMNPILISILDFFTHHPQPSLSLSPTLWIIHKCKNIILWTDAFWNGLLTAIQQTSNPWMICCRWNQNTLQSVKL